MAAAAVLRALTEAIEGNRDGAMTGEDPEFLHQLRVAVRRSRTVQRQLGPPFRRLPAGFSGEFRWLQRVTGDARDLDVYLVGFEGLRAISARGEPPRPGTFEYGDRALATRRARRGPGALASRRTTGLPADWEMLLESLVELSAADRPDATAAIARDRRAADPPCVSAGPEAGRRD